MKKKISLIVLVILCLCIIINLFNRENKTESSIKIIEKEEINIIDDWSSYETYDVVLNETYTITKPGIYNITGTIQDGSLIVNTNGNVKLVLNGVNIKNSNGPAINIKEAKNTYIHLSETTTNVLEDNGSSEEDGTLYSSDDLFIDGSGTLEVISNNQDGIVSKDDLVIINGTIKVISNDDGIRGKDSVIIKNGNITITSNGDGIKATNEEDSTKGYIQIDNGNITIESELDGIQAVTDLEINNGNISIKTGEGSSIKSNKTGWGVYNNNTESMKGFKTNNSITIKEATINLNTEDDAIHSNGDIIINSGTITISSGDDGIHADNILTINNGIITIKESYEGLEAQQVNIDNGTIDITASDDGINVAGGNDSSSMNRPGANPMEGDSDAILTINNGTIHINASGDGLDSNGSIYMNSGYVTVDGPTNDGNGALDYTYEFVINGGTLIAVGSSGMAQGLSNNSTQNSALINLSTTKTGTIQIGNITYTPSKSYSSILISDESLELSNSYDVIIDNEVVARYTQSSVAYSSRRNNSSQGNSPVGSMRR